MEASVQICLEHVDEIELVEYKNHRNLIILGSVNLCNLSSWNLHCSELSIEFVKDWGQLDNLGNCVSEQMRQSAACLVEGMRGFRNYKIFLVQV